MELWLATFSFSTSLKGFVIGVLTDWFSDIFETRVKPKAAVGLCAANLLRRKI